MKCPKCRQPIFKYKVTIGSQVIIEKSCGCGKMVEREGQRRFEGKARKREGDGREGI